MLRIVDIKSHWISKGTIGGITGDVLINTNRIKNFELYSSNDSTVKFVEDLYNWRESPMTFITDEAPSVIESYVNETPYSLSVQLPVFEGGDTSETAVDKYISLEDIVWGYNETNAAGTDTGRSFIFVSGIQGHYVVNLTIEEIQELSADGGIFTSFNFLDADNAALSVDVTGTIDPVLQTVALTVPNGTTVTALVASFTTHGDAVDSVKVSTTAQTSGTTANDFSSPVTYLLKDSGDTTLSSYVVTVTIAS